MQMKQTKKLYMHISEPAFSRYVLHTQTIQQ